MTKILKRRCGSGWDSSQKDFYATVKAMGQVYQCWRRICREINVFFFKFEYHVFYVLYPFFYLFTDCPSYNYCLFLPIIHGLVFQLRGRFGDWTVPPSSGKKPTHLGPID
jgi:hypothetical protein